MRLGRQNPKTELKIMIVLRFPVHTRNHAKRLCLFRELLKPQEQQKTKYQLKTISNSE
jgi:hypothetical protein